MRGIKRLKKCPCQDYVWGCKGFKFIWPSGYHDPQFEHAVKVRPKVTPYGRDSGTTARGQIPAWYEGTEYLLPYTVRQWHAPYEAEGQGHKYCMCSRAVYVDGKEKYVNYLFQGDPNQGRAGWSHWSQINTETGEVSVWPLFNPNEEGDPTYDADLMTLLKGSVFLDIYDSASEWYTGYDSPDNVLPALGGTSTNGQAFDYLYTAWRTQTLGADGGLPVRTRANAIYAGKRYVVFSGYINTDSLTGGATYGVVRYDNQADDGSRFLGITTTFGGTGSECPVVRPTMRGFMQDESDEPWCIGFSSATGKWATGKWTGSTHDLGPNIAHTYTPPSQLASGANLICYNRVWDGRDLMLFREEQIIGVGGAGDEDRRSDKYWMFDGSNFIALPAGRTPSYITATKQGDIIYGNRRAVYKLGSEGWTFTGMGSYESDLDGLWCPPHHHPDDPEGQDPSLPAAALFNSSYEDDSFQILVGNSWIHLRGFRGAADQGTYDVEDGDWPAYEVADANNSRHRQKNGGTVIPCWSISYDGTQRVPHMQTTIYPDSITRMHARLYTGLDPSIGISLPSPDYDEYLTNAPDPFPRRWPKWQHSFFPNDFDQGLELFWPKDENYRSSWGMFYDSFIGFSWNHDFDVVQGCECSCDASVKAY